MSTPDEIGDDLLETYDDNGPVDNHDWNDETDQRTIVLELPEAHEAGFMAFVDDVMNAQAHVDRGHVGLAYQAQRALLIRYMDAESDADALDQLRDLTWDEMQGAFAQLESHAVPKKRSQSIGKRSQSRSRPRKPHPRGRR